MKKFLTIISAILTAAVLLSGCESGNADIMTDSLTESETTTASVTEETESQTETTISETETTTETTTEITPETSETGTGGTTAEGLVISPSGYVLDPQNVLPKDTGFWSDANEEVSKSGLAYLLMELSDCKTRVYGACPDEDMSEIIIEHDCIADEFEEFWVTRYGGFAYTNTADCKFSDMDGDGENEVVMERYAIGGTFCCVDYLSVYKMEDGHYVRYFLDYEKLADEYIKTDIDNDAKTITVSVKNSDNDFVYDSSETCPEGVKGVWYTDLVGYDIDDNGVRMYYNGLINTFSSGIPIDDMIHVEFTVTLKDGEFVLSDPKIDIQK
ncbi:MAG: hypothetical protein K2N71_04720 [Oscillospiraceae bacterium]|nr:hypothetical protein [Oscillospiraceae bacterium]